jgi:membrane protein implicated in regulation of membrane protease activity
MNLQTLYFAIFVCGFGLCLLSAVSGLGHLHFGHLHRGAHSGHGGSMSRFGRALSGINGFTVLAFLTWFGGTGYLLERYSLLVAPLIFTAALIFGFAGAFLVWAALFRVLLPRERVLTSEETAMTGVLGRVSGAIRPGSGVGEIIFSQAGARRSSAARSEDGSAIERGAEVIVVRYERGIAHVRRWEDMP